MTGEGRRLTVLFRVAAGPRTGYGHLVRAVSLAEALGVEPLVSIRGGREALAAARHLGATIAGGTAPRHVLSVVAPALIVLDDRVANRTAPWRRAARAVGIPIASVHDLGLGVGDADLLIDASIRPPAARLDTHALLGPRYAILRAGLTDVGRRRHDIRPPRRVLVALGGGPRIRLGYRLARMIAARHASVVVGVSVGFRRTRRADERLKDHLATTRRVHDVVPAEFDRSLATADVLLTGGGVTLTEACCLGVPSVAVAVVRSQRPTIEDFAARGAAADGGLLAGRPSARACLHAVAAVSALLRDPGARHRLSVSGRRLVDGRGAARVAAELRSLCSARRRSR